MGFQRGPSRIRVVSGFRQAAASPPPGGGLMHVPENGGIGFAVKMEICCAPPYQTLEFSLKAKERNSGVIIVYSSWSVQVTLARRRRNSVAKSGDSSGAGAAEVGPDDGCFQRVRYKGDPVQIPIGFHAFENGIRVTFAAPIDMGVAADARRQFAQCWNCRYSGAYGSNEYSTTHPGIPGHDPLAIVSAHVLADAHSVFLEIPELQPVNQLHLRLHVNDDDSFTCSPAGTGHDMFVTVHKLDRPFEDFPGYEPREKIIAAHPLLTDLALNAVQIPNPWRQKIKGSREIEIETARNLSYATKEFVVKAGEPLAFTLSNPDVVPHNWVLVQPGALQFVGELGNQLIANPEAYARQYIPESDRVIAHTDIVPPGEKQTIYFQAPAQPGRYPFLCTFPGHWMVMNGVMVVE